MKYIDADKLIALIDTKLEDLGLSSSVWVGRSVLQDLKNDIITSLQQEQPDNMIQWTGNNLKEVIDFTGKSSKFDEWFKSWDEFESYVHSHDDILKLFSKDGSHFEVPVGAWIVKTPDGYNVPSVARFIHAKQEQLETDRKSPFTGGKVTIHSKEEETIFRGEKVKIISQYYRCEDTGREFTDQKLDDDMMWAIFRAYCEKKGITSFNDIILKPEHPKVDLEKEIESSIRFLNGHHTLENGERWYKGRYEELRDFARHFWDKGYNAGNDKLPEIELDKFTEKIKTFQGRYKHPEIVSIKGAMGFMARLFYQYPSVARQWYDSLPKATMD